MRIVKFEFNKTSLLADNPVNSSEVVKIIVTDPESGLPKLPPLKNRPHRNKKAYPKRAIKQKARTKHRQLTKTYLSKIGKGLQPEQDIVDYKRCVDIWNYT